MRSWLAVTAAALFVAACGDHDDHDHEASGGDSHQAHGEDHGHASAHGGVVRSIGDYHLELVVGERGALTLHVLGTDEKSAHAIVAPSVTAQARPEGGGSFTAIEFAASPASGESPGSSSRFRGQLPEALRGQKVVLTVTVPIGGKAHRCEFEVGPATEHNDHEEHDR